MNARQIRAVATTQQRILTENVAASRGRPDPVASGDCLSGLSTAFGSMGRGLFAIPSIRKRFESAIPQACPQKLWISAGPRALEADIDRARSMVLSQ